MFPNLNAEMARHGFLTKDIAKALGISTRSVRNKIRGITPFTIPEAIQLRDKLFPKMPIDILFSNIMYQNEKDA